MTRGTLPLVLCALGLSGRASAQELLHTVSLSWSRGDGADGCPTPAALMGQVRERLGRDPFAPLSPSSAEASVERASERWRARLIVRDERGAQVLHRAFEDASEGCETVSSAVVVSLVLALAPPPPRPPVEDPERAPPIRVDVPSPPTPPAASRARARTSFSLDLLWGPLPELTPGLAWRLDVPLSGRLRISGAVAHSPERRPSSTPQYAFGMTRAQASLCVGVRPWSPLELSGCAGLSFGLVHVVTFGPAPVDPGNYPWLAGLLELRAVGRLAGPLILEGTFGVGAAVLRAEFVAVGAATTTIHAQDPLAVWASVGLGVEF